MRKTLKITKRIPLTGQPEQRRDSQGRASALYVAIQTALRAASTSSTRSTQETDQVHSHPAAACTTRSSRPTASSSSPDPPAASVATVIDTETELPVWSIHFEGGVRPICFETNPDGSTKRMFVQMTNLHGFAIVDWAHAQGSRPHQAAGRAAGRAQQRRDPGRAGARHPDRAGRQDALVDEQVQQRTSTSYSMPDLKYLGERESRQGARLADLHARQQEAVRRQRARQLRVGDRRRGAEGDRARSRWDRCRSGTSRRSCPRCRHSVRN